MREITRLHVPSHIKYTKLVEDYTISLGDHIYPDDEAARNTLGAVMNEVFTNIVKHSNTADLDDMVRLQMEVGSGLLVISIYDNGPGIEINNQLPPYDESLIGEKRVFREVMDGVVYLTVTSPNSLSFSFSDALDDLPGDEGDLSRLKGHGLGLSIITKIMDSLTYTLIEDGKFDWKMIKKL